MSPRRAHRLARWLLPWLVARLLVPAGVMPAMPAGEPGWLLCSAAVELGAAGRQDTPRGSGGAHHDAAPCPFALAGASAPPPPALAAFTPIAGALQSPLAEPGPFPQRRPIRAHPARGPPQYS